MKICYVYSIIFQNGKRYIGFTSQFNPYDRLNEHCKESRVDNPKLPIHKAIKSFGVNNLEFNIIASGFRNDMLNLEIKLIKELKTKISEFGYNITNGGEGVSGHKHSAESKLKIKEKRNLQKINHSEETKKKISAANKGLKKGIKNPSHSEKMKGRKQSKESVEKRRLKMIGHSVSDETKAKIIAANTGRKHSETARKNMSLAHIGNKPSEETKLKMSEAHKKKFQDQEYKEKHRNAIKLALSTKDAREKMSLAAKKHNTPENNLKQSIKMKQIWAERKANK